MQHQRRIPRLSHKRVQIRVHRLSHGRPPQTHGGVARAALQSLHRGRAAESLKIDLKSLRFLFLEFEMGIFLKDLKITNFF